MKIVVFNGSPKGMTSVTMQYVLFLRKKFPQHEFAILDVCQDLSRIEEHEELFAEILDAVKGADGVLWAFPLYVLLVHAHYKRFIELLFERSARPAFEGKYAAVLSTSVRFYDHTAHEYVAAVCDDLGMHYAGSFSAAMYDLVDRGEQRRLVLFAQRFFDAIQGQAELPRRNRPVAWADFVYQPGGTPNRVETGGKKVIVVSDAQDDASNLARMVSRLKSHFSPAAEVVNLHAIKILGGCMGCIQCGLENACMYRDSDDVQATYARLQTADVLVMAGTIRDRYLSARWKMFTDRGFFNNHVPMFVGRQIVWLLSGPLGQLPLLQQALTAQAELQQANLAGIVTDECADSRQLDRLLESLARRVIADAATGYIGPPTFLGVAGRKVLRDEIWATLRFVFRADHRYYKGHGLYDFPRRSLKRRLTDLLTGILLKFPAFRSEFRKRIKKEMVKPLEQVLEKM